MYIGLSSDASGHGSEFKVLAKEKWNFIYQIEINVDCKRFICHDIRYLDFQVFVNVRGVDTWEDVHTCSHLRE